MTRKMIGGNSEFATRQKGYNITIAWDAKNIGGNIFWPIKKHI